MNKIVLNIKKYLKAYIISFMISILVGIAIFSLYFFIKGQTLIEAVNASTIAFVVLLGAGLLALVARLGMFDSFSYGFNQLTSAMFAKKANKYNDFSSYREDKRTKREASPSICYVIILASIIFGIATLVLFIILKSKNLY